MKRKTNHAQIWHYIRSIWDHYVVEETCIIWNIDSNWEWHVSLDLSLNMKYKLYCSCRCKSMYYGCQIHKTHDVVTSLHIGSTTIAHWMGDLAFWRTFIFQVLLHKFFFNDNWKVHWIHFEEFNLYFQAKGFF